MPSPFPGMNPYLENPALWREMHKLLIAELARTLNSQLDSRYRVAVEERVYQSDAESLLVGIPDDVVIRAKTANQTSTNENSTAIATSPQPVIVTLPMQGTVREWFLEVRRIHTNDVVTVIEILSPANKRNGEGRREYLEKRQKILTSATHLVEIDLLRSGESMPLENGQPISAYGILLSRSEQRPKASLYTFGLRDRIPTFPLPLQSNQDPEVTEPLVDLQTQLHQVYDQNRIAMEIDYTQEPIPALPSDDVAWADAILREQGLRA
jgi:hypothetical protein